MNDNADKDLVLLEQDNNNDLKIIYKNNIVPKIKANKNNSIKDINKLLNNTQNIINMSSNLTNNMITSLTNISNNISSNNGIQNEYINRVDIKTIVSNAKKDKRFYKLLNLCIKHGIHLFNQYHEICTLLSNDNLIKQAEQKQRQLSIDFSTVVSDISNNNEPSKLLVDIETSYNDYKKKFKEIEVIIYVLKNTYDDTAFEELCCIKTNINTNNNSSSNTSISPSVISSSQTQQAINEQTHTVSTNSIVINSLDQSIVSKASETKKMTKKEKMSKYIAVYSN